MSRGDALKGYEAIAAICGRPTWKDGAYPWTLHRYSDDTYRARFPGDLSVGLLGDEYGVVQHVALCLWREHVRAWLLGQCHTFVAPQGTGWEAFRIGGISEIRATSYDEALQEAVSRTAKEA